MGIADRAAAERRHIHVAGILRFSTRQSPGALDPGIVSRGNNRESVRAGEPLIEIGCSKASIRIVVRGD